RAAGRRLRPLSLHDALPISVVLLLAYGAGFERAIDAIFSNWGTRIMGVFPGRTSLQAGGSKAGVKVRLQLDDVEHLQNSVPLIRDRKSTRLNSSHLVISYAV